MPNLTLQHSFNVHNYIIEISSINNDNINYNSVSVIASGISDTDMPSDMTNLFTDVPGVYSIRILDQNMNLLLNSEKFLP
jgi:hypothetical protein